LPIDIVGAPIKRETNGLAMSSRNQFLSAEERERAGEIHRTLQKMSEALRSGMAPASIESMARERLTEAGFVPDYAALRRADDLREPLPNQRDGLIALIAARLGKTRLIDNLPC
jgi:pantoate--beta-alanine ligase